MSRDNLVHMVAEKDTSSLPNLKAHSASHTPDSHLTQWIPILHSRFTTPTFGLLTSISRSGFAIHNLTPNSQQSHNADFYHFTQQIGNSRFGFANCTFHSGLTMQLTQSRSHSAKYLVWKLGTRSRHLCTRLGRAGG